MDSKTTPDTVHSSNVLNQYFATFAANLIMFGQGFAIGWTSPALPLLASEQTPLVDGPLTSDQVSWIGAMNCIGALVGTFLFGYLIALIGSKRALLVSAIPTAAFWLFVYYGNHYYHILVARFLSGVAGGGMQSCIILFVSEIADNEIRGRLSSVSLFLLNIGTLGAYFLGATVDYYTISCICVTIPIIFAIIFTFLPNTPQYYLAVRQNQLAEDAMKYYKGSKKCTAHEDVAMFKEFDRLKSNSTKRSTNEKVQIKDLFNRKALKGLIVGMIFATLSQFTANFTIVCYAVMVFEKIGTSIDANVSSIILAVALIFGSLASTYFSEKLGRKALNLISFSGSAIGLFIGAGYHYLNLKGFDLSMFEWVPVASLSFVIFISSAGVLPLVFVCAVEYMPQKIRTTGVTIILVLLSVSAFVSVKVFPILLESQDVHGCFMVYAIGSVAGALFVHFVMEETKGKALDDDVGLDEKFKMENHDIEKM